MKFYVIVRSRETVIAGFGPFASRKLAEEKALAVRSIYEGRDIQVEQ